VFLKSLEIFGFKSFADRTLIEFSDGISALLGPNGCGKSNVVDAIKWVVGEQSAKSLRADSMEDIIFNGTETRKPLSVAEVTVTISNEQGLLPIDVPEVAIKRRLYRSGEAEYFINGKPAKLKEVRELFWDTGIGKSAYSVMEQGKIDQILSSKPEDRRYLFEEAAGITKDKVRSREAELKLEKTEENLRQVQAILAEVKRSHDSLKIQSDKTLKYRTLRDEVFNAELDVNLLKLRQFTQDRDKRDEEINEKTVKRDKIKGEIDSINSSLEEGMGIVNTMQAKVVEHTKTIYGLAVDQNGKKQQRKLLTDHIADSRAKIDQAEVRKKGVNEKLSALKDEEDEKEGELSSLKAQLREMEKNIASFEGSVKMAEDRIRENEAGAVRAEQEIADLEKQRAEARKRLDAITEDIVSQLDARLKESGYSAKDRKAAESEIDSLIDAVLSRLEGSGSVALDIELLKNPAKSDSSQLIEKAAADLADTASKMTELKGRYEAYKKTTPAFIDEFLSPEGIITKKRAIDREIDAIDTGEAERRAKTASLREENVKLNQQMNEYRKTLEELRGNRIRSEGQIQAAEQALSMLKREVASQEGFLKELDNEIFLEQKSLDSAQENLSDLDEEIAEIEQKGQKLQAEIAKLQHEIEIKKSDTDKRQDNLQKKTDMLGNLQNEIERLHLSLAQTDTEIRNVKENFQEQYSRDLMEFESRMYEIRTPAADLRDLLTRKRQALKDVGTVNLMAPEEFAEVKERYDFLSKQVEDIEKAREDLKRITDEIRTESAERFLENYNRIKKNFHNMFRRLFGGGRAELRLVDPDHILESGIEIYAQPPGKKLEAISLLSGGEKTMTAIALLFATYMVRPSPFCFLDEIDAALDEPNVIRFVNLLQEFGRTSQFIVISHNKKTVTGARTLLGVTMEESGVTKVVAVRLGHSDGTVAQSDVVPVPTVFQEEDVEYESGTELPPEPEKAEKSRSKAQEPAAESAAADTEKGSGGSKAAADAANDKRAAGDDGAGAEK